MTPTEHLGKWMKRVAAAAELFETRWTMIGLRRHDRELALLLQEQRGFFNEACITQDIKETAHQGAALIRGYQAAIAAMEKAEIPDDCYVLGVCPTTGFQVAIGTQKAAMARVVELHGEEVVWLTPDEVATLMASSEAFMTVAAIKRKFPGAEVVERYAGEGS